LIHFYKRALIYDIKIQRIFQDAVRDDNAPVGAMWQPDWF